MLFRSFGVNLGYATVLDVTQVANEGNDIESELVMGQGKMGFRLGSVGLVKAGTQGIRASPDMENKLHDTIQGGDGEIIFVRVPERVSTCRAMGGQGSEIQGVLRTWTWSRAHGETSSSISPAHCMHPLNGSAKFAVLVFFGRFARPVPFSWVETGMLGPDEERHLAV